MPYNKFSTGRYCSVVGCGNCNRLLYIWKEEECQIDGHLGLKHRDCPCCVPFRFFQFPKDSVLKLQWIKKLSRKNFTPGKYAVVCSKHFLDGKPTVQTPIPVLHLGYKPMHEVQPGRRILQRIQCTGKKKCPDLQCPESTTPRNPTETKEENSETNDLSQEVHDIIKESCEVCGISPKQTADKSTQWEVSNFLVEHNYALPSEKAVLKNECGIQTNLPCLTPNAMTDQDYRFYTSISMNMFLNLIVVLTNLVQSPFSKLSIHDQVLLVFCRIRLGLVFGDLSRRFNVSSSFASNVYRFWIPLLAQQFRDLIVWLPRSTIRNTMPYCFKSKYPRTTCVIDCAEIFLERARSHWMRSVTYSNYKGRNTIKFLIAIAPNGFVMFVSDSFGGRASDKFITQNSGFLKYLLPGDQIMADRGFLIEDILPPDVRINIPPFTKGKTQLSEQEVTRGRRIASVRVHVERVIAQLKKYKVLKSTFPLSQSSLADSILVICAALCNLQKSVVTSKNP